MNTETFLALVAIVCVVTLLCYPRKINTYIDDIGVHVDSWSGANSIIEWPTLIEQAKNRGKI